MHSTIKRNVLQHKINRKKTKVTSYYIWPGNGEGLFLFQHFINLPLSYLLKTVTRLLTALEPTLGWCDWECTDVLPVQCLSCKIHRKCCNSERERVPLY